MRLTSDLWVASFMRKIRGSGGFAYLLRRGAEEAGAVFIRQILAEGKIILFGPAPQVFYEENTAKDERLFIELMQGQESEIMVRLNQELKFDPDIWILDVENFVDFSQIEQLPLVEINKQLS